MHNLVNGQSESYSLCSLILASSLVCKHVKVNQY
uniref:Uncharacterized protein n=1 Tax=Arundo donax TaxID=35708 RepID=A0A0A8ZH93_ARUDO